jgi:hypothetical protein
MRPTQRELSFRTLMNQLGVAELVRQFQQIPREARVIKTR